MNINLLWLYHTIVTAVADGREQNHTLGLTFWTDFLMECCSSQ